MCGNISTGYKNVKGIKIFEQPHASHNTKRLILFKLNPVVSIKPY
jgi:hypothetical protein